jgi:hypothetical protein
VARKPKQGPPDIDRQRGAWRAGQVCPSAALSVILTIFPAFTQPALLDAVIPPPLPAYGTKLEPTGGDGDGSQPGNYAVQPPFRSDELWSKVLRLLNERSGAITKERLENVFGVRFTSVRRESDATTYLLKAGKDWYFDARVTIYNDKFKFAAPLNGAHSQWFIGWGTVFGGDSKHACITAEHARADLLASGWTSPWKSWGFWEKFREQTAKDLQEHAPPGGWVYPPMMPEPRAGFFRRGEDDSGYRDRLPQGEVFGTGDFADSCVTGILVTGGL